MLERHQRLKTHDEFGVFGARKLSSYGGGLTFVNSYSYFSIS